MSLPLYILTHNCARTLIDPANFSSHLFDARPSPDPPHLLVLSLQEVAPIAHCFIGGSLLTPYFTALRHAVKLTNYPYTNICTHNVGLTAIMIFVLHPDKVSSMQIAGVGVGVESMGNKGAVGVRMNYDDTAYTFVAAHLAAAETGLQQRNEDWKAIVQGLVFGGGLLQESPSMYCSNLFFAGDLNYRTSDTKPKPDDKFPTKDFSQLLEKDQLTREMRDGKTLHGLAESPINFPPTYKYSPSGEFAKHRWPSWCDRILYLEPPGTKFDIHKYAALPFFPTSDHRAVALALSIPTYNTSNGTDSHDPPFGIDPDWKSKREIARKKEVVVGVLAYLALTREGNGIILATIIGGLGIWLITRSMLVT